MGAFITVARVDAKGQQCRANIVARFKCRGSVRAIIAKDVPLMPD